MKRLTLLFCAAFLFVAAGCCKKEANVAFKVKETPDLLAAIDGTPVYEKDMDFKAKQDIYNFKKKMVDDFIINDFMKKNGYASMDQLIEKEVKAKVKEPTEAEMKKFYAEQKITQPYDQIKPQIQNRLKSQLLRARWMDFNNEIRAKKAIVYYFDMPRADIAYRDNEISRGPKDAKVTLLEYTDYQCPYCKQAQTTVDELWKKFSGKIKHVYRAYPLPFHAAARDAANASMCANEQGKFWEYHTLLFKNQEDLYKMVKQPPQTPGMPPQMNQKGEVDPANFFKWAGEIKLDEAKFKNCFETKAFDKDIQKDMDEAGKIGVTSTPSFFINGSPVTGNRPISDFEEAIKRELELAKAK
jgi:protein-disulfide isomerase